MKEWYLIGSKTKPNMIGGYENQGFLDFKEDAFAETLETELATTVLLCNSDLSEKREIRCIIQGNLADTSVQSNQRKGLFLRGTVKDGMYVFFENAYWLIIGYPGTNGVYEKVTMSLCQFPLRWQNQQGKIVERWVYSEDFTKYSNGTTSNDAITIGDNQYGLTIPIDEETKKLKRDMRFPIDFDDSECPDIYRLTNRKTKLNDNNASGHGGTMIITMSFDSFNGSVDKKVIAEDGQKLWICNYMEPVLALQPSPALPSDKNETAILSAAIRGNSELQIGFANTYSVEFISKNTGETVDSDRVEFAWNVDSEFDVLQTKEGNDLVLLAEDARLEGKTFKLQIIVQDMIVASSIISITGIL